MEEEEPHPFTVEWWHYTWTSLWKALLIIGAIFSLIFVFIANLLLGLVLLVSIVFINSKALGEENVISSVRETIESALERINWKTISFIGFVLAAGGATVVFFMETWKPGSIVLVIGVVLLIIGLIKSPSR